jgi:hypothetical protein
MVNGKPSIFFSYIYNKVYAAFGLDICQEWRKFCIKGENFLGKVLLVRKKCVPLHPLSETEALGKSSLTDLHRQK